MPVSETETLLDSFSFRPNSETYLARYNHTETSASTAVIATLAEILETDPTELDPLFHSVDVESLNALLSGVAGDHVRVTSTFAGHDFTVTGDTVLATQTHDRSVGDGNPSPT
ncbi:HalOD1 output domain-containing protein [Halorubrum sp. N11]|uniref:HalOD1 output domain-containing protein n=1 Tax=Halorubrum sp. N11 TaxID=3402276 RepID=UPI003EBF4018